MKEKDRLLLRKQEEAKDYEAKYHIAESRRWEAASHVNELTLVMGGVEPKQKAGKQDSKAELRKKFHLMLKSKEVRAILDYIERLWQ